MLGNIWEEAQLHIIRFLTAHLLNQFNSHKHICSHGRSYTVIRLLRIHLQQDRYLIKFDITQVIYRIIYYGTGHKKCGPKHLINGKVTNAFESRPFIFQSLITASRICPGTGEYF